MQWLLMVSFLYAVMPSVVYVTTTVYLPAHLYMSPEVASTSWPGENITDKNTTDAFATWPSMNNFTATDGLNTTSITSTKYSATPDHKGYQEGHLVLGGPEEDSEYDTDTDCDSDTETDEEPDTDSDMELDTGNETVTGNNTFHYSNSTSMKGPLSSKYGFPHSSSRSISPGSEITFEPPKTDKSVFGTYSPSHTAVNSSLRSSVAIVSQTLTRSMSKSLDFSNDDNRSLKTETIVRPVSHTSLTPKLTMSPSVAATATLRDNVVSNGNNRNSHNGGLVSKAYTDTTQSTSDNDRKSLSVEATSYKPPVKVAVSNTWTSSVPELRSQSYPTVVVIPSMVQSQSISVENERSKHISQPLSEESSGKPRDKTRATTSYSSATRPPRESSSRAGVSASRGPKSGVSSKASKRSKSIKSRTKSTKESLHSTRNVPVPSLVSLEFPRSFSLLKHNNTSLQSQLSGGLLLNSTPILFFILLVFL